MGRGGNSRSRVKLTDEYSTIWLNTNPTHLLNKLEFIISNITRLSDIIKANFFFFGINPSDLNYEKPNIIYSKLKYISISQIINYNMSNKINHNN